jgi:putative ABC transport system ATP-binding protein
MPRPFFVLVKSEMAAIPPSLLLTAEKSPDQPIFPYVGGKEIVRDFELGDYIIRAVDNVTVEINECEYVALVGASGAGKTSLLHLFGGLDKPTKGQIFLSRVDISPMELESLATFRIFNAGIIFQNYNLISSLTAAENIMFPMQLAGVKHSQCEHRSLELLDLVGLKERADHLPVQLSAGEQQRVAIARALANDPPIILADEPTANLDKKNALFIAELFEKFSKEGKTIIVATHDDRLIGLAHRIIEMEDGKIIADKRVREVEKPVKQENSQVSEASDEE